MKLTEMTPSNLKALVFLISPIVFAAIGIHFSLYQEIFFHLLGIVLLSVFFTQSFILLHECGHHNFFKLDILNSLFGNFFGILTMIPFLSWKHMHNLHHRWTGWRDKDPTTEKTVEPSKSPFMRIIVNLSWLFFIPIFFIVYMFSNYWNVFKMKRHLNRYHFKMGVYSVLTYLCIYSLLFYFVGGFIWSVFLPPFLLSLVWKELIILTQHTHIEIPVSEGENVKPISYKNQVQYTRSFYTFPFVSKYILFNFNLHEAHHVHPGIPAYWLDKVKLNVPEEPTFAKWFIQAKSMSGVDFIFRTSKHTKQKF